MMVRSEVDLTITTFGTLLIAGADAHDYKLVQEVTVMTSLYTPPHTHACPHCNAIKHKLQQARCLGADSTDKNRREDGFCVRAMFAT